MTILARSHTQLPWANRVGVIAGGCLVRETPLTVSLRVEMSCEPTCLDWSASAVGTTPDENTT
ncbi:hypothetical protein HMPREF9597_00222 [Cutibacterium acnes HL005PA4]|uniref:Uncharacterized protein n=1 Tax=Cutibacterium acnes TaxID=1747 RepID=A0AA44U2U4_CUTAC|nr:hypothetical protein HMPREF9597_00222 [Cutibacterium acnes HL005PA4]EFT28826.1 hypothetical protein HMPREF9594_01366 [Cutibacterium acnes HL005PA1]PHJ26463.1 hypothetical protein APS60_11110 [Cutibacterium acnes]REB61772.1 hypothetical protein CP875_09735 [Cutibacterium acnes]REB62312.1 hypothetical protein CP873_07520 [Cutibacterium acnes]